MDLQLNTSAEEINRLQRCIDDLVALLGLPAVWSGKECSQIIDILWRDLRVVTSEIRADWDLSRPGLREAWDAGDLSHFHGWNKKA